MKTMQFLAKDVVVVKVAALLLVFMAEVQMQPTTVLPPLKVNETISKRTQSEDEVIQLWQSRENAWKKGLDHGMGGTSGVSPFTGRGVSSSYILRPPLPDGPLPFSPSAVLSSRINMLANERSRSPHYKLNMLNSRIADSSKLVPPTIDDAMGDAPDTSSSYLDSTSTYKDRDLGPGATGPGSLENTLAAGHHNHEHPYVDIQSSPNVTALLGKTAYLTCRVKNLGDKTVSWVRHRDIHLLTVGRYTYTTDQRFRAILQPDTDEYSLMIKYPQHRDAGIYECQVSTTPHLSHYVHLSVVEPVTEVIGGPELFIDRGSTINLTCTVKYSPEPPSYIIWNHNDAIISYNSPRGGVSVLTEKGDTTTSYLLIQQARQTDSGRYSCNPSNAVPHGILVHVLNEELPAAMHTGGQTSCQISQFLMYLIFSFILVL